MVKTRKLQISEYPLVLHVYSHSRALGGVKFACPNVRLHWFYTDQLYI